MKKYILFVLIWFNISGCSTFTEEVIGPEIELTAEQIEQIEREKFDAIVAEEDRKIIEIIQQKKQLELDNINKLYEEDRKKMTVEEIQKESELLNLNKMSVTPVK